MLEIVNVVGSGRFNTEFDLQQLALDLGENARYEPEMYPGLYLQVDEDDPLTTIFRTGRFNISGAESESELCSVKDKIRRFIAGRMPDLQLLEFSIQNVVCTGDFHQELDLSELAVGLGLENTEYEPEQFAGLIYHPKSSASVVLVFRTGKAVITGGNSKSDAEAAFEETRERIDRLLH